MMKRMALLMLLSFALVMVGRLTTAGFHPVQTVADEDDGGDDDGGSDDSGT